MTFSSAYFVRNRLDVCVHKSAQPNSRHNKCDSDWNTYFQSLIKVDQTHESRRWCVHDFSHALWTSNSNVMCFRLSLSGFALGAIAVAGGVFIAVESPTSPLPWVFTRKMLGFAEHAACFSRTSMFAARLSACMLWRYCAKAKKNCWTSVFSLSYFTTSETPHHAGPTKTILGSIPGG